MTETTAQYDVLVVGAGIAGLALMRALHQRGFSAPTLERRAEPQDAGFAINLLGNAIDALDALGLGEGVRRHGHPVRRHDYRTARGARCLRSTRDLRGRNKLIGNLHTLLIGLISAETLLNHRYITIEIWSARVYSFEKTS